MSQAFYKLEGTPIFPIENHACWIKTQNSIKHDQHPPNLWFLYTVVYLNDLRLLEVFMVWMIAWTYDTSVIIGDSFVTNSINIIAAHSFIHITYALHTKCSIHIYALYIGPLAILVGHIVDGYSSVKNMDIPKHTEKKYIYINRNTCVCIYRIYLGVYNI